MKKILIAIIGCILSFTANASQTFRVELNGTDSSNECIVFVRHFEKEAGKKWDSTGTDRLELSCEDLVRSGLASLNKDSEFKISRKAMRMKPNQLLHVLSKAKPPVDLVAVHECIPIAPTAEEVQTITLKKGQAICLDTSVYESVLIGDIVTWKIVEKMLVPSTKAGDNTLILINKGSRSSTNVRIKIAT